MPKMHGVGPPKTSMRIENNSFEDVQYLLLKVGFFDCDVSFPGCNPYFALKSRSQETQ